MKKKIINGLMMVALIAATSASFVSCKDNNEDVKIENALAVAGVNEKLGTLGNRLDLLEDKYTDLDGKISTLRNRLNNVADSVKNNADSIAAHSDSLAAHRLAIADNTAAIDSLEKETNALEAWLAETFAKLVTNVEISGTYNNMTGSINIPGFEPKMLIYNYGVASQAGTFPKNGKKFGSDYTLEWTAGEEIGAGEYNQGFAGYIYANVNRYLDEVPMLTKNQDEESFFDFSLVKTNGEKVKGLTIVNMNKEGGPTDDVLQWGWTRHDNNIYKFGVSYSGKGSDYAPAKIDLSTLKEDIKAVWRDRNRKSGTSKEALGRLLADLYYKYLTRDTKLAKYSLKIAWADNTWKYNKETGEFEINDKTAIPHLSTSEAELVFAAIKPLGFNSGDALAEKVNNEVGRVNNLIERSEKYLNKLFDKIKKQLPDLKPEDIKSIVEGGDLVETETGWALQYIDTWGGVNSIDVTDIINPMNDNLGTLKNLIIDYNKAKQSLKASSVTNWVEKFTNKFNTLFAKNADQMLQPTLLAINSNGEVNRVSGLAYEPYVATGEVTLKPTTYTAEVLAPCYAKFVGCKDIDAENFNKILFAGDQELKFTPKAGKLYEIVYEAVDFSGNVVEHTYYIMGGVK